MIETQRLRLRQWHDDDLAVYAALNADPHVMEFLGSPLAREDSDRQANKFRDHIGEHGWGLWAVEVLGGADFIGFLGLWSAPKETHFAPAVEIGWRFAHAYWGNGYATEGAKAVCTFAFESLKLAEVVSFTTRANTRSRRVMEKIGMTRNPQDDFDHPRLATNDPLRPHVLYRVRRQ